MYIYIYIYYRGQRLEPIRALYQAYQNHATVSKDRPNVYGLTHCDGLYFFGGTKNNNSASKLDMGLVWIIPSNR